MDSADEILFCYAQPIIVGQILASISKSSSFVNKIFIKKSNKKNGKKYKGNNVYHHYDILHYAPVYLYTCPGFLTTQGFLFMHLDQRWRKSKSHAMMRPTEETLEVAATAAFKSLILLHIFWQSCSWLINKCLFTKTESFKIIRIKNKIRKHRKGDLRHEIRKRLKVLLQMVWTLYRVHFTKYRKV